MLRSDPAIDRIPEIVRQFAPGLPADEARAVHVDLAEAGLTSLSTVKLMLAIEAAFDLAISDEDLTPENFRSIAAIERLVTRLSGA